MTHKQQALLSHHNSSQPVVIDFCSKVGISPRQVLGLGRVVIYRCSSYTMTVKWPRFMLEAFIGNALGNQQASIINAYNL